MTSVLFVSHDDDLREVATRVLSRAGWTVSEAAHSGHALLAIANGRLFDVLVVEEQMPEESGGTLLQRLRRFCPNLQVVYMCNRPRPACKDNVVVRPFTADDLNDAVLEAAATGATA